MKSHGSVFSKLSYFLASTLLMTPAFFYSNEAVAAWNAFDAIPASNCIPRDKNSLKKLELIGGAWQFRGNKEKGTAILECPVETLGLTGPVFVRGFLVYFKDSDGAGNNANINFALVKRLDGVSTVLGTYDTSDAGTSAETSGFAFTNADIGVELWYMRVEMYRKDSDRQVEMGGFLVID